MSHLVRRQAGVLRGAVYRAAALVALVAALVYASPSRAACLAGDVSHLSLPAVLRVGADPAGLSAPARIATDFSGNLYVTDPSRGAIVIRSGDGEILATRAGLGYPVGIAVDRNGRIYVGDGDAGSVTVFTSRWEVLFQLGRGPGEFIVPSDIDVDQQSGDAWVADGPSNAVRAYDASGALRLTLGGPGTGTGQFDFPVSLFVDSDARQVLVVDQQARRVQVFDLDGRYVSCFGGSASGAGGLGAPQGLWVDARGRVYIADSFEGWVKVMDRAGNDIGAIGDFGENIGQVRLPLDVAIDRWNRLFVANANNSRLEIYELAGEDPLLRAVVALEPDPLYRGLPQPSVFVWVQIPGAAAADILASSVVANGVPANPTTASLGDHDGDGTSDLRLEFEWTALLATLPEAGPASVMVSGAVGDRRFDAAGVLTVVAAACGPQVSCSLGDADPRCNEAACQEPLGCTVRPIIDGASCQDQEPCTSGDTCEHGQCVGGSPPSCDDFNPCTDDSCATGVGCVHTRNAAPCDDGDPCTSGDSCGAGVCRAGQAKSCDDGNSCTADQCEPGTGCVHRVLSGAGAPCDDGDSKTVDDVCQESGLCLGDPAAVRYGVTQWPMPLAKPVRVAVGADVFLDASVCVERIAVGPASVIAGDLVASGTFTPVLFVGGGTVAGDIVTGSTNTIGLGDVSVGGRIDTTGTGPELTECSAAASAAGERWRELRALPASPALALGAVTVQRSTTTRIPSDGTLGAGTVVIDLASLTLDDSATLVLVGDPETDAVVVRVAGTRAGLVVGREAHVIAESVAPQQVLFAVDGKVKLQSGSVLAGTVLARGPITVARSATIDGALFGNSRIRIGRGVRLDHSPFVSW